MDQAIKCVNFAKCGGEIYFTDRDREFYAVKGWAPPKRCKPCVVEKKKFFEEREKKEVSPFNPKNMRRPSDKELLD